jgi:hypothetical protein
MQIIRLCLGVISTWLFIAGPAAATPENGEIRSVQQVVSQSTSLLKVNVHAVIAGGCGKFDKYTVFVLHTFKGREDEKREYDVCGYSGLSTAFTYIIGLEPNEAVDKEFFYPDAIFMERLPGEYYRAVSYQSNVYTAGDNEYLLAGIGVPNLEDKIQSALGKIAK